MSRRGHSAPEAAVGKAVDAFMRSRGWRVIVNSPGYVPGGGSFGEKGMPDRQYLYYQGDTVALCLWVELKPPNYKPKCNCEPGPPHKRTGQPTKGHECRNCGQLRWAATETARGATVMRVNDVDVFERWYVATFAWLPAKGVAA